MKVFIVYAHPESKSFNAALKDLAVSVLKEQGHQVKVSDLYSMNFKAVADKNDFAQLRNPDFFKYQFEQITANKEGTFASDILAEQEKLLWADYILFHFPLWWLSVPAIMKGWIDRVLAMGFCYGGGVWFDKGGLHSKKAMAAVTTGSSATMFGSRGLYGDINKILYHLNFGTFYFVGMEVLPPFVANSVAYLEEKRKKYLEEYRQRLLTLETTASIPYPKLADVDEQMKLKSGLKPFFS